MSDTIRQPVTEVRPTTIADVRVSLLQAAATERIGMAFGDLTTRSLVLITVESVEGVVGHGESWVNHPSWAGLERIATLQHGVLPLLVGRDAADISEIHRSLLEHLRPLGIPWGAPGPIMQAISGVNLALWDLLGRTLGVPVSTLFGGRVRDRVRTYASSLGPNDVAEGAARCRDLGFTAAKLRLGFDPRTDSENLAAARHHLGDDVELLVDVNQAWSLRDALANAPMLSDHGVGWVEEPLKGNALPELEDLHERTGLRIATGENLYGRDGLAPYLASPGVDVLQPDLAKSGGFSEVLPIAQMGDGLGKRIVPHLYGGAVAYAATLQLAACVPSVDLVEFDIRSNPLRDPLLATPVTANDGAIEIPRGPGLGIELDLDAVAELATDIVTVNGSTPGLGARR